MLPTFQSLDDRKTTTKTYLKRTIKPPGSDKKRQVKMPCSSNSNLPNKVTARVPLANQNGKAAPPPPPTPRTATPPPSLYTPHTLSHTTIDSNGDTSICAMRESSIQVSENRLKALYLQLEENQKKIIDPSLQSRIQRSGSISDVLSIFSKFETRKGKLEVQRNHLEEAKQNYIQALAKYDGQTIEALKEIGNINEEFNGLIINLEKLPISSQSKNNLIDRQPIMIDKEVQVNPPRVLFKSPSAEFLPTMQIVPLPPSPILRSNIKSNKPDRPRGDVTPIAFKL
ncbi:hypothetical protein ACQ4LE_007020 [Meloidogyne hapla]|uniref:TACC_C domain-containing protein n=1 Tax=Meloidogyne hapla TaxID=6305 RepID=A0A1I8B172_MELHA